MLRIPYLLLACVSLLSACATDDEPRGPIEDCQLQTDGSMICPRSFPGCVLAADTAVQFARCGHRYEYVIYGRAADCPEVYYYPEGSFLSPSDWEAHVPACDSRTRD